MDIDALNDRSREIFRLIVDTYLETGEPGGSRTLSRRLGRLSAATIRNVMADLEQDHLLASPHTSAGRLPTQRGLRFYLDGLMQVGEISPDEKESIDRMTSHRPGEPGDLLKQASEMLSGLSDGIGMVVVPKADKPVKTLRFMPVEPGRALVVIVFQDGHIENRMVAVDPSLSPSVFEQANNVLTRAAPGGLTMDELRVRLLGDLTHNRLQLDALTADLVQKGVILDPGTGAPVMMIVKGQSRVLSDVQAIGDLERARDLMDQLEQQDWMLKLLEATKEGDGVQIFIGTENQMFKDTAWSMVLSPYRAGNRIVGAIGVIGPARQNYRRIVPIVDYTAHAISRLIDGLIDTPDRVK